MFRPGLNALLLMLMVSVAFALPFYDNASSNYTLTQNISTTGTSGINVTADNVTIDCAGYSLIGDNSPNSIGIQSSMFNTTIQNCNVQGFPTSISLSSTANSPDAILNSTANSINGRGGPSNGLYLTVFNSNITATNTDALNFIGDFSALFANQSVFAATNGNGISLTFGIQQGYIDNSTMSAINGNAFHADNFVTMPITNSRLLTSNGNAMALINSQVLINATGNSITATGNGISSVCQLDTNVCIDTNLLLSSNSITATNATVITSTTLNFSNYPNNQSRTLTSQYGASSVNLTIPANSAITNLSSWDSIIGLSVNQTNASIAPTDDGTNTVNFVVSTGSQTSQLNFNSSVRLLIPSVGTQKAGFVESGSSTFNQITTSCAEDTQSWADANLNGGQCNMDDGNGNMVIWTQHLTDFYVYKNTPPVIPPAPAPAPSYSGGSSSGGGEVYHPAPPKPAPIPVSTPTPVVVTPSTPAPIVVPTPVPVPSVVAPPTPVAPTPVSSVAQVPTQTRMPPTSSVAPPTPSTVQPPKTIGLLGVGIILVGIVAIVGLAGLMLYMRGQQMRREYLERIRKGKEGS